MLAVRTVRGLVPYLPVTTASWHPSCVVDGISHEGLLPFHVVNRRLSARIGFARTVNDDGKMKKLTGKWFGTVSKARSSHVVDFVYHPAGWPTTYKRVRNDPLYHEPHYSFRLDGGDAPPRLADDGPAPNEHPSISKLANLKVWFGDVNSPNRFAEDKELARGSKYAVIDCCDCSPFGARMTPSQFETVVVKVMGFEDQPEVGVVPLFMFVLVPMIMELLHKDYWVLVNCKKGCNRCDS